MKNFRNFKFIILIISAIILFNLTACWDNVELEKRGFVISIGIDKYVEKNKNESNSNKNQSDNKNNNGNQSDKENNNDNQSDDGDSQKSGAESEKDKSPIKLDDGKDDSRLTVSMALPKLDKIVGSGTSEEAKTIKKASSQTLTSAIRLVDSYSSQKLYFGHTKLCILGKQLLNDDRLIKECVDGLERDRDLSKKLLILATDDDAEAIISNNAPGEPMVGMFISNFFQNNSNIVAVTMPYTLEDFVRDLRKSGNAVIPKISLENDELKLGGAAVIKDYKLKGWLNDIEMRGFLWLKGECEGAELIVEYNDTNTPFSITEDRIKVSFYEEDNNLKILFNSKIEGVITEYIMGEGTLYDSNMIEKLEKLYANEVVSEIRKTEHIFKNEMKLDAFNIKEKLRKENYDLYLKFEDDWETVFENSELVTDVKVTVRNIGAIK